MSRLDTKSLKRDLNKLKKGAKKGLKKGNQKAGESVLDIILDRTARGRGPKGRFAKYTKEYAKIKKSNKVDLRNSGDMLDSLRVINKKNTMLIEFSSKKQEKKAEGLFNDKRAFMGYTKKEWRTVGNKFSKEFKRHI